MPSPYQVALSAEVDAVRQRLIRRGRQAFTRTLAASRCRRERVIAVLIGSHRLGRIGAKAERARRARAREARGKIDG